MLRSVWMGVMIITLPTLNTAEAEPNPECQIIADFSSPEEAQRWSSQNDNVMGGRSTGGPSFDLGYLTFSGFTNMNGGGFSSIRARYAKAAFAEAQSLRVHLRSDGRSYQFAFRTTARDIWRRPYAFRAAIPQTPISEWVRVTIPLQDLPASVWGQPRSARFDPATITEYGFFIYDGISGAFSLDVRTIEVC